MPDQPIAASEFRVLRDGGLALEGRIVKLGLVSIVIDDKPDRQALSFTFDGPGVLGLRAESTGKHDRHIPGAADAMTDKGPISAWVESAGLQPQPPMVAMPQPGDRYAHAFTVEPGQCWAMVHDYTGQATHCAENPTWTGRWFSPRGDGRWWRVRSCPDHIEGLTGLRQFGQRPRSSLKHHRIWSDSPNSGDDA